MTSLTADQYQCEECKVMRRANIDNNFHQKNIQGTSNGLVIYSDIHRCANGILGINNLHVDHNLKIRSNERIVLPSKRSFKPSIPNLPTPNLKEETQKVLIREFHPSKDFRLLIDDLALKVQMNIGAIDQHQEEEIAKLFSENKSIILSFYPSEIEYTDNVEKWLLTLINLLEKLPPTRIGLFIETLRYISGLRKIGPAPFHIEILKLILSSHKVFFEATTVPIMFDTLMDDGIQKYGQEAVTLMVKILSYMELNPNVPLLYYTNSHHEDIGYLIYLFLTLEQENLITIHRPLM